MTAAQRISVDLSAAHEALSLAIDVVEALDVDAADARSKAVDAVQLSTAANQFLLNVSRLLQGAKA